MNTIGSMKARKITAPPIPMFFSGTPTFSLIRAETTVAMPMAAMTVITPFTVKMLLRSEGLSVSVVIIDCIGTSVSVQVKS